MKMVVNIGNGWGTEPSILVFFGQILKLCAQMPISVDRRSPGAKTGMGAIPKFGAQVVPMMAWTPGEMAHVSCSPLAASH